MVWSEQLPFPLVIVDATGNTVATIDENGVHVIGTTNEIDIIPNSFYDALIQLYDKSVGAGISGGTLTSQTTTGPLVTTVTLASPAPSSPAGQSLATLDVGSGANDGLITLFVLSPNGTKSASMVLDANNAQAIISVDVPIIKDSAWTNITLQNGWQTIPGGTAPRVRKMPDGTIMIEGAAQNGTNADNTIWGTLPAGYAPTAVQPLFVCGTGANANLYWVCQVDGLNLRCFKLAGATAFNCDGIHYASSI